jgi:hypothetical protein
LLSETFIARWEFKGRVLPADGRLIKVNWIDNKKSACHPT